MEDKNLINVIFVKEKEQSVLMELISVMTDCFLRLLHGFMHDVAYFF